MRSPSRLPRPGLLRASLTRTGVLLLLVSLPARLPAQEFAIHSIDRTAEAVILHWANGTGPFQVQSSPDVRRWSDLGRAVGATAGTFPAPGKGAYYRIRDLGDGGLGAHLGQLQVMQGEFGNAFARHRLKALWDLHLPADPPVSQIPSEYFRRLVVRYQHLNDNRIETLVGTFESFPGGSAMVSANELTFTWRLGAGADRRDFTLVLDFPYPATDPRAQKILVSDPYYTLTCRYASPQPVIGWDGLVTTTREDEVALAEISMEAGPGWWRRDQTVRLGRVAIRSQYTIGLPLIQGAPPFIFKTPILQQWNAPTTISGLTSEPFELAGDFSRTYFPSHHNFTETLYLEPRLEPGIDPALLEELRAANIRIIIPFNPTAFPESDQAIQVFGFDGKVRSL